MAITKDNTPLTKHDLIAVSFTDTAPKSGVTTFLPVFSDNTLSPAAREIDKAGDSFISSYLKAQTKFKGKACQTLLITSGSKNYVLIGMGDAEKLTPRDIEKCGGTAWGMASKIANDTMVLDISNWAKAKSKLESDAVGAHFATGLQLSAYDFPYFKGKSKEDASPVQKLKIITNSAKTSQKRFAEMECATQGQYFARDLVNTPPNFLLPETYAHKIKTRLKPLGIKITVLDEKKMDKLGMGAFLAVGQGSSNPPRLVVMEWDGRTGKKAKSDKPLAFVGKGVTFDTGGISIKPSAGMEDMKLDMGGSAAVVGLMETLARRKANTHVVGIVGLVENMPDGNSYRPADIVTSMSGKTIEVLNTDAEGRLVLADALTYVQKNYDPQFIVDLATLTGAMMVALGFEYCGSFVNDNDLWDKMEKASASSTEKLWRMPLDEQWRDQMKSEIADIQNMGKQARYAGACTAAGFLENFIDEGRAWAHMDIAGTAWIKAPTPTAPKGGTGFGVRVLNDFVKQNYG